MVHLEYPITVGMTIAHLRRRKTTAYRRAQRTPKSGVIAMHTPIRIR